MSRNIEIANPAILEAELIRLNISASNVIFICRVYHNKIHILKQNFRDKTLVKQIKGSNNFCLKFKTKFNILRKGCNVRGMFIRVDY